MEPTGARFAGGPPDVDDCEDVAVPDVDVVVDREEDEEEDDELASPSLSPPLEQPAKANATITNSTNPERIQAGVRPIPYLSTLAGSSECGVRLVVK